MIKEGEGIVIDVREYGNNSLIIKILSKEGKFGGFLKNGLKLKDKPSAFNLVSFKLNKRLEEHLGVLKICTLKNYSSFLMKSRIKNIILCSIQEVLTFLLEDENPDDVLYIKTIDLLNFLIQENNVVDIISYYLVYEQFLLSTLGFSLDFSKCALGSNKDVYFISPVSGRCASFEAGKNFKDKLFVIPRIYGNKINIIDDAEDLRNAFNINSHFLQNILKHDKLKSRFKILNHL